MKKLTKETEKRIMGALEKASSLISDGVHPNEAIYKTASESKLLPGHVQLMVNAVNTGLTNAHRKSASSVYEKAAEFPVADISAIMQKLYPDEIKTASAIVEETVTSDEYNKSPNWLKAACSMAKAKRPVNWKMTGKKSTVERYTDNDSKKAFAEVDRSYKDIDSKRLELTAVRDKAIKLANDLNKYFATAGHIALEEVKENATLLFGEKVAVILKDVKELKNVHKIKTAAVNINLLPYSLIKEGIHLAEDFITKKESYEGSIKTAAATADKVLSPFVQSPKQGQSILAGQSSDRSERLQKAAFMKEIMGGILNSADVSREIGRKIPGAPATGEGAERKDLLGLLDPAHDLEIRNIQAEALLNDLMANDEVVRGHDPNEVIDAFNEVSQFAPYATDKKVIMRDLMRRRLAGGPQALDQFAIGDTLKNQQSIRDLDKMDEGKLNLVKQLGGLFNNDSSGGKPAPPKP